MNDTATHPPRAASSAPIDTPAPPVERAVLVTTAHRGVFFGYAIDTSGDTIYLRAGRLCVRWEGTKGFMGLAAHGPNDRCKIGPAADIEVRNVTSVCECTAEAVEAWERAPWAE